ncbi:putative NTP binding protein [Aspergillus stella-maris]|uniref:putative NTP binding protein n=1 Tax=Aspergillus stella-maris TaxID=1810926 RepID=UPI003CCD090F
MVIDIPLSNGQMNGAAELASAPETNKSEIDDDTPPTPPPKRTPTKLPVLKVVTDRYNEPGTSPGSEKGRDGSPEYESPKHLDKERERYWQKIRDRFDKDSLTRSGAYRKFISLATSSRQEIAKDRKNNDDSSPDKSSNSESSLTAKTNILTPRRRNGFRDSTSTNRHRFSDISGRTKSNHSASSNDSGASSLRYKTGSTTNSSINTGSSVSPISSRSSRKEWEDRFVVHMPSAREPNPPTMGVRQIAQYQKSIERVQTEGGSMVDPDTLPSPRSGTPEQQHKCSELAGKRVGALDGHDARSKDDADPYSHNNRYYCPDEIGKGHRISTIWEEASTASKQKSPPANSDGSFLGCKEINGPNDRNPDEILYFSTPERPKVVDIPPARMPKVSESKLNPARQSKGALGETKLVQEEWEPISRNLKHAQCSKPSPKVLCREAQCHQLKTNRSTSLDAKDALDSIEKQSENQRSIPKPDDVFIITPTITRTMVTMTDLREHLPKQSVVKEPVARSAGEIITDARTKFPTNTKGAAPPSGLRRLSQNSWQKSSAPSATPLAPAPATDAPAVKFRADAEAITTATTVDKGTTAERPRGMRGCIRTPGIPRSSTDSRIDPLPDRPIKINVTTPLTRSNHVQPRKSSLAQSPEKKATMPLKKAPSPPPRKSSMRPMSAVMQAKIVNVAELDGYQVDEQRETNSSTVTSPDKENKAQPAVKKMMSSDTIHMTIDMIFVFVAQVQGYCRQIKENRASKVVLLKLFLNSVFGMLEHCLLVLRRGLGVLSEYNTTGVWPKTSDGDIGWLLTDIGQALVYLAVLGFIGMVFARAVGFIILTGTWILWLVRPFVLAVRAVSRFIQV